MMGPPEKEAGPAPTTEGRKPANAEGSPTATSTASLSDAGRRDRAGAALIMRQHAIEYAQHHWQVGPLCESEMGPDRRRRILGPFGKDPVGYLVPHGVLDFTDDVDTVLRWWSRHPWNIGVRVPESLFVLDVDGPDRRPHPGKGLPALAKQEELHGPLPETFTQITGSGGLHLFFRRPPGKLGKAGLPDGLEYKDHGGYVVAAPSIHPDTRERYVRCDHAVAAPPAWLVDLIVERHRPAPPPPRRWSWARSGSSIADDYCSSVSWADILQPHGWRYLSGDPDGDGARWLHPTATSSCSATVRNGCLFVYSPNTPFDVTEASQPKGYTKFRAYAVLEHHGDMKAAARALTGGAR